MPVVKYLEQTAFDKLAESGIKTHNLLEKVVVHINTGGNKATVISNEVAELMGKPAADIKAAVEKENPPGSGTKVALATGDFAIDEDGVTHMFVADPALKGTADAPKQWHEINMGITLAQADARYAQLGTTEFAPKIKLGQGGFGTQWAIGDQNFGAMKNGQEFIIDFDPANIATVSGWDPMAVSNDTSAFFVVPNIDAIDPANNPLVPLPAGGGAYTLPTLRDGNAAFLLPKFRNNYKANTFRFKKNLVAGKSEATATWDDWTYDFVKLEPKVVPIKYITKKFNTWADLIAEKDEISLIALTTKVQVDHFGAAIRKDAFLPFMPFFTIDSSAYGSMNMSNGVEYKSKLDNTGVTLFNAGTQVGTGAGAHIGWDKFDIYALVATGNALTSAGGSAMLMGTLSDIYDLENGRGVIHAVDKVLNVQEIAELVKDQRAIDLDFMATFRDQISYSGAKEFTYDDMTRTQATPGGAYAWTKSGLASYKVPVAVNANTLTYDNLISPYNRIKQEQANFTSTFLVDGMSAVYKFFASNKALKFSGNNGQTYKWETFGKFENNARVPYIRFSGTGTMQISNNALTPAYTAQALPYEMKLADLMTNTDAGRVAIVDMEFNALPAIGTPIMDIDYVTSTLFVENRFKSFLGGIEKEIFENKSIKFKEKLDEVRNHAINIKPATPHAATVNPMPYTLKKGLDNSWATNDERFIIQVFDTKNKEVYTTFYDDANADANTYSGQPAIDIRMPDGSMKKFYLAVWTSDDAEGAVIDFLESDQVTKANLPFEYEAYITLDVQSIAKKDFTNIKIPATIDVNGSPVSTVGKLLRVKADGGVEYVETHDAAITFDDNSTGTWKVIKG